MPNEHDDIGVSASAPRQDGVIEVNRLALSDFAGQVCITFEKRCDQLTLSRQEAMDLAEKLARQTYRAAHGDYPTTTDRSQITEQMRVRARNRVRQMLQRFEPKSETESLQKAAAIVDEIMKMVL